MVCCSATGNVVSCGRQPGFFLSWHLLIGICSGVPSENRVMGLVVFMWMVANTCSIPVFGGVAALRGVLGVLCLWVDETITESNPIQSNPVERNYSGGEKELLAMF